MINRFKITVQEIADNQVKSAATRPKLGAEGNKNIFDKFVELVSGKFNDALDAMTDAGGAAEIGIVPTAGMTGATVQSAIDKLDGDIKGICADERFIPDGSITKAKLGSELLSQLDEATDLTNANEAGVINNAYAIKMLQLAQIREGAAPCSLGGFAEGFVSDGRIDKEQSGVAVSGEGFVPFCPADFDNPYISLEAAATDQVSAKSVFSAKEWEFGVTSNRLVDKSLARLRISIYRSNEQTLPTLYVYSAAASTYSVMAQVSDVMWTKVGQTNEYTAEVPVKYAAKKHTQFKLGWGQGGTSGAELYKGTYSGSTYAWAVKATFYFYGEGEATLATTNIDLGVAVDRGMLVAHTTDGKTLDAFVRFGGGEYFGPLQRTTRAATVSGEAVSEHRFAVPAAAAPAQSVSVKMTGEGGEGFLVYDMMFAGR